MTVAAVPPPSSFDPRDEVTELAFRVSPALLGTPLARPMRRGWAMLVDVVAVAVLASAPATVFGAAIAYVLLRAATRPKPGTRRSRVARLATGALALLILYMAGGWLVERVREGMSGSNAEARLEMGDSVAVLDAIPGIAVGAEMVALARAPDEPAARRRAEELVGRLRGLGVPDDDIAEVLSELASGSEERPWVRSAVDSARVEIEAGMRRQAAESVAGAMTAERLLAEYAAIQAAGDSAAAARLRPELERVLAADTVAALESTLAAAGHRAEELETELDRLEEGSGLLASLRRLLEDLGLGLGWGGLYFTAFTTLWRGQTPGKRLLGIRTVRLDGTAIGWWNAFERFAGYAAGLATGLLGFLQIYWDANRQAIQDKIAGTVVIEDRGAKLDHAEPGYSTAMTENG